MSDSEHGPEVPSSEPAQETPPAGTEAPPTPAPIEERVAEEVQEDSERPQTITFKEALHRFRQIRGRIEGELRKVIIGQEHVQRQLIAAILSRGHALLVGVPGLAKTLLVSTLARTLELSFKRIQFTPDLMPSDITGTDIIDVDADGRRAFRFVPGPLFANIVLADEINRTPPKTQAALLEAMQERQVTVGNRTYALPNPFFVIATQNPLEQEGTYPLPEAQQDRFMLCINVGYPNREEEEAIIAATTGDSQPHVEPVADARDILISQRLLGKVQASRPMIQYATSLVRCTRPGQKGSPGFIDDYLSWGAGPRGGQFLVKTAKVFAIMDGRAAIGFEDLRDASHAVLRHRIALNYRARADGLNADAIIDRLLQTVPVPR